MSIYSAIRGRLGNIDSNYSILIDPLQRSLTNIAAAIRLDDIFASAAKELVIMGGYVDLNLYQLQSAQAEDIGSDINFLVDPEAAHIVVTALFPSITIAGNVASQQYLSQTMLNRREGVCEY